MFNLKSMQLEGFRGFPKSSDVFEFSAPAVLLYGDNHQGKSSVLNAIEWCLYGDQCLAAKSRIRKRVGAASMAASGKGNSGVNEAGRE